MLVKCFIAVKIQFKYIQDKKVIYPGQELNPRPPACNWATRAYNSALGFFLYITLNSLCYTKINMYLSSPYKELIVHINLM